MKTSKILMAMALPVAFAACTSEEIVENSNNLNMQNRKVIPAVTAVVESGVDSRFSWNEETFGWNKFTAEDKFAAGLTDATLYDVQDLMMTNYIYSPTANGYETTSQMVEGTYFFYSFPGFEKVAARQGVPFDLTTQKSVDFKKPTAAVEANQLFVSALYKLDAETANEALPIKFVSYWSTAGMKIKNTTGDDIKIVRILITADEAMPLKGILAPSALGDAADENKDVTGLVYYNNGTDYVLPKYYSDEETEVEWNDIKTIGMADTDVKGGLAEKTMMMTVENGELADDEEATVYFQMPAGEYSKVTVTYFVEVTNADGDAEVKELEAVEFAKNAKSSEDAEEEDITAFYRGGTTAVFGVLNKEIAAHKITELDVLSATESGAYAATYEDLVEIIKAGNETTISNMGDLKIDDAVIALFKSTTANKNLDAGEYYVFNNPIEITTEKTAVQTLKNIQVKNAEIVKGKFNVAYNLIADAEGGVTVAEGAELKVSTSQAGTITNIGTVKVENAAVVAASKIYVTIVDGATTENKAETTVELAVAGGAIAIGDGEYENEYASVINLSTYPTNLKLNAPKKDSKAVATEYKFQNGEIAYGKKLYIGEKVTVNDASTADTKLTVNGYVENKGTIKYVGINGTYDSTNGTRGASIDNYGVIEEVVIGAEVASAIDAVKKSVKENVTITMKGESSEIKDASLATAASAGVILEGRINNNEGGYVTADSDIEVYATVTENTTGKINISDINTLYVSGITWTDGSVSSNIETLYLNTVTLANSGTSKHNFKPSSENIYLDGVTSNNHVDLTGATDAEIKNSVFNQNLKYNDVKMTDVTVKGTFTTSQANPVWAGVTLNKVTLGGNITLLTIDHVENYDSDGDLTSYTVKTTTLNDAITYADDTNTYTIAKVEVMNDAVLTIKNDVTLKATNLKVNAADADIETSVEGVVNVKGTLTVTTTDNQGEIND